MTIDHAVPHGESQAREIQPTDAVASAILLETPHIRVVLDALGVVALFATIALAMGPTEAVAVTAAMGAVVATARMVRVLRS